MRTVSSRAIYDADRQHVSWFGGSPTPIPHEDARRARRRSRATHERGDPDQLHRVRQHHPHGHAVARSDAEVDGEQMRRSDEQRAADESDRGQRNLRDDEAGCHASPEPESRRPDERRSGATFVRMA
jgi:hypothetical protein